MRQMANEVAQELVRYCGRRQRSQRNGGWETSEGHDFFVQIGPYCQALELDHSPATSASSRVA